MERVVRGIAAILVVAIFGVMLGLVQIPALPLGPPDIVWRPLAFAAVTACLLICLKTRSRRVIGGGVLALIGLVGLLGHLLGRPVDLVDLGVSAIAVVAVTVLWPSRRRPRRRYKRVM